MRIEGEGETARRRTKERQGEQKREENDDDDDEEEEEEARVFLVGESYNSTKHNPRVNLTSPVKASWTKATDRKDGRAEKERKREREREMEPRSWLPNWRERERQRGRFLRCER